MARTLLRVHMPEKVVLEMDQFDGSGPLSRGQFLRKAIGIFAEMPK